MRRLAGLETVGPWGDALRSCLRGLSSQLTDDQFSTEALTGDLADELLLAAWDCVPALIEADVEETGQSLFGLDQLLGLLVAVVGPILTAIHLVTTGVREVFDELAAFGGPDDPFYDIRIRAPVRTPEAPTEPLVCPDQGFEANSDNVATQIRSTVPGLDCEGVVALVATVAATHNFYSGPGSSRQRATPARRCWRTTPCRSVTTRARTPPAPPSPGTRADAMPEAERPRRRSLVRLLRSQKCRSPSRV